MWKIYIIRNTKNTKKYIGITKRSLKRRFVEHINNKKSVIGQAIKKYCKENFIIETIDASTTLEEALEKETFYIKLYKSSVLENGYNIIENSTVRDFTPEMKIRHVESLKNIKNQNKKNPYLGIFYSFNKKSWCFSININNISKTEKGFSSSKDAAIHRDYFIIKNFAINDAKRIMNFPELYSEMISESYILPHKHKKISKKKSNFFGVFYEKQFNKWRVRVNKKLLKDTKVILTSGLLDSEKDAAERADYIRVVGYKLENNLNFPENLNLYKSENYIPPITTIEKNKKIKHKNISFDGRRYSVFIQSNNIKYRKSFKTLKEAITQRDEIYKNIDNNI